MSHYYARVNPENIVTFVTLVPDEMIIVENGLEIEDPAINHLYDTIPNSIGDRWIRTSREGEFRRRYARIGGSYNDELDAFINPKPFESWNFNEVTVSWEAPIPKPEDGQQYSWDEEIGNWKPVY